MMITGNFQNILEPVMAQTFIKQTLRDENGGKLPRNWRKLLKQRLESMRAMREDDRCSECGRELE